MGEHEDGEVRALGGRDADVPPLGAEGQQREGDCEGARGGGGLLGGGVQPQQRAREHDKRRRGQQPVQDGEVRARHGVLV